MFIISGKKVIALTLIFVLTIVLVVLITISINKNEKHLKSIFTAAVPSSNNVVIIDAGHGRRRPDGAVSKSGVKESDINLKIALKLQNILEQSGTAVILTRSDEKAIYDEGVTTLRKKKISDIR